MTRERRLGRSYSRRIRDQLPGERMPSKSLGPDLGLRPRIGPHTGEVEQDPGAIRGIAVVVAARIGALAEAGQIFVSATVRDLVAGSGVRFEDRGSHVLKGVPDERKVYEVATPLPR